MKNAIILVCLLFSAFVGYSQVGIGTKNPDSTSVLDLSSTTKGLLIPRMTTMQRNAIISPAMGLQILNVDDMCLDIYDGRHWIKNCGMKEGDALQGASRSSISDSIWTKDGDRIFPADPSRIGIGTELPDSSALLDIASTSQGFLMPRMTTAQRDLIVAPAVGLQIINLDDFCLDIYDGNGWIKNCGLRHSGQDTVPTAWIQRDDCPGGGRFSAVAFAVGGKGYVGTGTIGAYQLKSDFWEYNPFSKCWSQVADFEGGTRESAVAFSIGNKGYVGTGYSDTAKNDFWEYDPITNDWVRLQDFPGSARWSAVGLSINGKGYIGTGTNGAALNDFYEYDPIAVEWTIKEAFDGEARFRSVGFVLDGKGYVGSGANVDGAPLRDFRQYDPITNNWMSVDSLPVATSGAKAFTISNKGYIFTRTANENANYLYKFDPTLDEWTLASSFPGTVRIDAVGLSIGNSGFVGTGSYSSNKFSDFWEYRESSIEPVYTNSSEVSTAYSFHDGIWSRELENTFLTHDGNVGIGIDLPANKLDLSSETRSGIHAAGLPMYVTGALDTANGIEFRHSNGTQGIGFGYNTIYAAGSNTNQNLGLMAKGTGALKFTANGTERMRITGDGNIGIGTDSPAQKLHVIGNAIVSENIGIGTDSPAQKLHVIGNAIVSEKIGIGTDSPAQKLHVNGNAIVSENLGIGNSNPQAPLQFANDERNRKIVLWDLDNNDHQFSGFGINNSILRYQVINENVDHVFYAGTSPTTSKELIRIRGNGNVGIGITNPHAPLQFKNANASRKIVLFEATNDDNQFTGFGVDPSILRYNVSATSVNHVFYAGTSPSTKNELMRITGTGNVGIGISNVTNKMDINGNNRTGESEHPTGRPLYVTGNIGESSSGIEFRHDNGTQGIGFGWNTIYATGSQADQDLGLMARGSTGNLKFTTSNTERMRILGNGNIGIGTTTPHAPLQFGNVATNRKIVLWEATNNDHEFYGFGINNNTLRYQVVNENTDHVFYAGTSPSTSAELMRITGDGKVGINVIDPKNKTDIHLGAARSGPHPSGLPLYVTGDLGQDTSGIEFRDNNGTQGIGFGYNTMYAAGSLINQDLSLKAKGATGNLKFTTGNTERMRIQGDGNVGIGTMTPHAALQFENIADNRKIVLFESVNNEHEFFGFGINPGILRYQVAPGTNHVFYAGTSPSSSVELMRLQSNGKVGIGISIANNKLDINGNNRTPNNHAIARPLYVTGDIGESSNGVEFRHDNGTQGIGFGWNTIYATGSEANQNLGLQARGSTGILKFTTGDTERMRILGNGYVGIGTPTPQFQLQLSQNSAAKPGTFGWTIFSDSRLKKDIEPFTDGLDLVRKINPIWFRYNGMNGITDTARFAGIIAQEIEKIAPYMISTTKSAERDGTSYLTYDANSMMYILINAVKEQQIQIQQQQDRIDILEKELKAESTADVADMKAMMAQMQNEIQQLKQERK